MLNLRGAVLRLCLRALLAGAGAVAGHPSDAVREEAGVPCERERSLPGLRGEHTTYMDAIQASREPNGFEALFCEGWGWS